MRALQEKKEKDLLVIETELKMRETFAKEFEQFSKEYAIKKYQVLRMKYTITCSLREIGLRKCFPIKSKLREPNQQ